MATSGESIEDRSIEPETSPLPVNALVKRPLVSRTVLMALVWILVVIGFYGFGNLGALALGTKGHAVTTSLVYLGLSYIGYPVGSLLSMTIIVFANIKVG